MKKILLIAALFVMGATVSFAQNKPKTATAAQTAKPKKSKKVKPAKAVAAAMYECPMKCEAPSAKAGKCGKCGMDLVAVKK
jgi:hypothetical protein